MYPVATPPVRGAPVSPPAMARMEVENAARDWRDERNAGPTALEMDCRYIIADCAWKQLRVQRGQLMLCTSGLRGCLDDGGSWLEVR